MKDRNLIIFVVILIIMIIILFNAIISIVAGKPTKKKVTYVDKTYEKKVEEVRKGNVTGKYDSNDKNSSYYNLEQDGRDLVDKIIDDVVELVNDKRYEDILNLFLYTYRNSYYPNVSDVEEYISSKIPSGVKVEAKNFRVNNGSLYFSLYEVGTDNKALDIKIDNYDDFYNDEFDSYLYFSNIVSIDDTRILYIDKYIRVECNYCVSYPEYTAYVLEIENNKDKDLKIDFQDTKLNDYYFGTERQYDMVTTRYLEIPARKKVRYEMGFKNPKYQPEGIYLKMDVNGEKVEGYMYITAGSEEDDV